ncbi:unnamed protein product [Cunninghamella blakesleeana]
MPKAQRQKTRQGKPSQKIIKNNLLNNNESAVKEVNNKALKKKLRHEAWLEKLDTSYSLKKKQEKKANRKGALNKGFDDFADVLNIISDVKNKDKSESSSIKQDNNNNNNTKIISSDKIKSQKAKKKSMMQEILRFQNVMKNDAFKNDPLSAIRLHVQNSFN